MPSSTRSNRTNDPAETISLCQEVWCRVLPRRLIDEQVLAQQKHEACELLPRPDGPEVVDIHCGSLSRATPIGSCASTPVGRRIPCRRSRRRCPRLAPPPRDLVACGVRVRQAHPQIAQNRRRTCFASPPGTRDRQGATWASSTVAQRRAKRQPAAEDSALGSSTRVRRVR